MQTGQGCFGISGGAQSDSAIWSGYHSGASGFTTSGTPTTWADLISAGGTPTFTETLNYNMGVVRSTLTSGTPVPGVVLTPPAKGIYEVTAAFTAQNTSNSNYVYFRLTDGTRTLDFNTIYHASAALIAVKLTGYIDVRLNPGPVTVKIQGAINSVGNGFLNANYENNVISWSIKRVA